MASPRVIILTWNPHVFTGKVDSTVESWSCQSYRKTKKGDKFVFIRTGNAAPGLLSFGDVTSDPFFGKKIDSGEEGYFVEIQFKMPFQKDKPIITRDELYKIFHRDIKERTFSPQSSGAELDPEVAKELWPCLLNLSNQVEKLPKKTVAEVYRVGRSEVVKGAALNFAKGICQLCNKQGPFKHNGRYFLEVHHVLPLSKGGPDGLENVIALCPNCHRKMHLINDKEDKDFLLERAKELAKI